MAGLPTHFDLAPDEPVTIRSYYHLLSEHVKTAHTARWMLQEMEGLVNEAWLHKKPIWGLDRACRSAFQWSGRVELSQL